MTPRRRRRWPFVLPLVLLLAACADNAPQDTLEPEGSYARKIDDLFDPVLLVAGVVFLFVNLGVVYLMVRFRRRHGDDDAIVPTQTHGNTRLEIGWTVLPAVILVFVAVGTVATLLDINDEPDDAMRVTVYGQQWWWSYEYDLDGDGAAEIVTANDLVIPAGQPVNLDIRARDVIHSFWAPRLNGKRDAVPGRTHPLTLEADNPGTFVGQCTEFCGLSHAYMHLRVVALPEGEFDEWVEHQQDDAEMPTDEVAEAGAELFRTTCSSCHLARGINDDLYDGSAELVAGVAPDLTHFASRGAFAGAYFDLWRDTDDDGLVDYDEIGGELNRADLEAWLRNPPEEKPMDPEAERGMPDLGLTEEQIDQLVAFLEALD